MYSKYITVATWGHLNIDLIQTKKLTSFNCLIYFDTQITNNVYTRNISGLVLRHNLHHSILGFGKRLFSMILFPFIEDRGLLQRKKNY